MTSPSEQLILVSSNPNKAIEAERILGMPLLRVSLALPEIQAATVEEITRYKLEVARSKGYERLIVEDVSLGFDELGHFPGPYIKWLLEAAGGKGLGAIAYATQWPNPWPRTFGFHEVFHVLVIAAATAHYVAVVGWVLPAAGS